MIIKVQHTRFDDVLYFGVLLSLLIRWCVSLFPYSGQGKPPMYGDFEAQRHWMEITLNLPIHDWYRNTSENDLQYWGLDYPPLTAYHSLLCGYIAQFFDSSWVALMSHGHESYYLKIFMRSTVVFSDMLLYYPAVIYFWTYINRPYKVRDKAVAATLMLLYPGLILIDHGHFQYNCISLGLVVWAVMLLTQGRDIVGAFAFTLALHYKQMSLYHALPFFCYLLGSCFQKQLNSGIKQFVKLTLVVLLTSAVCWAPFLTSLDSILKVIHRLFPFGRGLYEDKVANVWCALSVVVKLRSWLSISTLVILSAVTTLVAIVPSSLHLLYTPTIQVFKLSLVNSSLVFFLFSFQVHEKSILLAALPVCLLLDDHPLAATWFLTLSTFSLLPLLAKDGLVIPYFSLSCLFLIGMFKAYGQMGLSFTKDRKTMLQSLLFLLSIMGCLAFSISHLTVRPPPRYPHLHVVLNVIYSCSHFLGFLIYFHHLQFKAPPASYIYKLKRN